MRPVICALCLLLSAAMCGQAFADKRVALVIGNGEYEKAGKLSNPIRDAEAMDALLQRAGFELVEAKRNLSAIAMRRALRNFADRARDADIAVVFYAGHGIEVNGSNYLVPVDAILERDIDVEDEAVPLDRVMQILEQVKRLRLVILDACRDNPFARTMKRTIPSRSIGRGLAEVRVMSADTLIAFAAKAGSTASDGMGTNSPYTAALVKHLTTPGLDIRIALGRVRDEVVKSTGNGQEPFVYGSLGGSEISLVAALTLPPPAAAPAVPVLTLPVPPPAPPSAAPKSPPARPRATQPADVLSKEPAPGAMTWGACVVVRVQSLICPSGLQKVCGAPDLKTERKRTCV